MSLARRANNRGVTHNKFDENGGLLLNHSKSIFLLITLTYVFGN